MKKCIKKLLTGVLLGTMICAVLTGCGSGAESSRSDVVMDMPTTEESYNYSADMDFYSMGTKNEYDDYAEEPMEESAVEEEAGDVTEDAGSGDGGLENTVASNRKLIRRVNLSVETQGFEEFTAYIEDRVNELGGYMESSEVFGGSYEYDTLRRADYVVRVPVDKLDVLVGAVSGQANVTHKSETATDVTLTYVDTKSRKEAYEVEYERLMALLEKAEDIDTIVALESRMTNVRYEIQGLESQLRTYDNLVDYATVDISVSEVKIYTPTEPEKKSDWERMAEGFVTSVRNILYDLKEFAIDFVVSLPYLIVWAVIIGGIVLIVRKSIKRRKMKKEKKNAERYENRVRDTDRTTECGEVNTDESVNRTEDSHYIQ